MEQQVPQTLGQASALTQCHTASRGWKAPGWSPQGNLSGFVAIERCCPISHVSTKSEAISGTCTLRGTSAPAWWWVPLSDMSSASPHFRERDNRHLQRARADEMGLGPPTTCTLHPSPYSVHPPHCFTLPVLALSPHTAQLPVPAGIPARWECSLATVALGRFVSAPRSSSLFPPSHQPEADCSSPVLSLQRWGGIGGDLQVLAPTAFITPSAFLRKEISHEPQWKSQTSTRGVEFRVWTSCSPLMDLTRNFDNGTKTSLQRDSCFYYHNLSDQFDCKVCSYNPKETKLPASVRSWQAS